MEASEILSSFIVVDAAELRRAGFSLRELLSFLDAGDQFLRIHPPPTKRTLFDSQLKSGGFSAYDFRAAGCPASRLSASYFWKDALTPGEAEWDSTCAFFDVSELRSAGYSALELRCACFDLQELEEAGFSDVELEEAEKRCMVYHDVEAALSRDFDCS